MSDGVSCHGGSWCVHSCVFVRVRASGCFSVRPGASRCVSVRPGTSWCVSVRAISLLIIILNGGKRGFLTVLKPRHSVNYARLKKTWTRTKEAHSQSIPDLPNRPGRADFWCNSSSTTLYRLIISIFTKKYSCC
jgi:hypothetical protein